MLGTILPTARRFASERVGSVDADAGPLKRAANSAQIISVVVIGVVALVGTLIFSQIYETMPDEVLENDEGEMTSYGESAEGLVDGFGGAIELVPVVLLVIIAALVISVVQRMRMQA